MDPISIITVVAAIVASLATGFAYFRSSAVKVWEQNSAAYQARVTELELTIKDLRGVIAAQDARLRELESRPDWTQVVDVMHGMETNIIQAVKEMRDGSDT